MTLDGTVPLSLQEIESLILSLYEPNPPEAVSRIQSTLSHIQSSPQAWILARHLLERSDDKVKFFGILTIIIKLNTESSLLSDEAASELLISLVGWYLDALRENSGPLVVRKLSSALSTFFIHFHRIWTCYVRHLVKCLSSSQVSPPTSIDDSVEFSLELDDINPLQLQASLWVVTGIMEDLIRFDLNAPAHFNLYDSILTNMPDSMALMAQPLREGRNSAVAKLDSIKCLQSWVVFSQRTSSRNTKVVESLRPLIGAVIDSLVVEELYDAAAELLIDVLSNYSSLLTEHHIEMLSNLFRTEWFKTRYERLIKGDCDFDSIRLAQLLLSFGEASLQLLIHDGSQRNQELLSSLCGLLTTNGYPLAEDKVFVPAIEFWSTFAESLLDIPYSNPQPPNDYAVHATTYLLQAVDNAWQKAICPPSEEFYEWDSSDRAGFVDARKDIVDFLQSVYALVGPQLVDTFSALTLSSLSTCSWLQLEAAVFCIGGLADCSRDDARCDDALSAVFSSSLFSVIGAGQDDVPTRTRQTCLTLIEQYTEYFQRNFHLLPAALSLLFAELRDETMAISASKSILRLCSSCRSHLQLEMNGFFAEYQNLIATRQLDCVTREKVMGALASVAQAIPDNNRKYTACAKILGFIQEDVHHSVELARSMHTGVQPSGLRFICSDISSGEPLGLHVGLRALRNLAGVGKGFQAPSDLSIDLEATYQHTVVELNSELTRLQQHILAIVIEIRNTFACSAEVTEFICSILRSGFSEIEPGPFVFTARDIAHFLVGHQKETPRIGLIVATACSFISSLRPQTLMQSQEIISKVLTWVIGLLKQLLEPEADLELTQNGIDFATRILGKCPLAFIRLEPPDTTEFFFLFALRALDGNEPLPKAAAAEFWTTFVGLKGDEYDLQEPLRRAMVMLGPLLTRGLINNFGGNASRSELDRLAEPLKRLVSRYPMARQWLQSGLHHPAFPSNRVTAEQKAIFVKRLISLRGSRATNQVVRDFWLNARGSSFAYAS